MRKESLLISKTKWREILKERRQSISPQRRLDASQILQEKLRDRGTVLSFSPIGSEIDLGPLNRFLASENRLFLVPYKLNSLIDVPLAKIDCILVPALGFDREKYRIGYGHGYYDRFLASVGTIPTIGVGFQEQLCEELLPRDPWDIPVKELILV
jgi:5-formyltetrahydrofolate cyclo-ligase